MFPLYLQDAVLPCFNNIIKDKSWLWHLRYEHLSFSSLTQMCKQHMVRGMPYIDLKDQVCEACALGKHAINSFSSDRSWRASHPLALVHTDICGPMRTTSLGGNRYLLIFV